MLNQILAAIPRVLAAALWIGIAFIAGKFLKSIIEAILPPTGFDDAIRSTGVVPAGTMPSRVVANIAMVAIVLIASIEAAKQLGGGTIAVFLAQVTALGGKVIFGTLIIVVGIMLSRIIAALVGSGTGEGGYAQALVRYAIIALFTAIGLTFMGLADQIVILAFGLILGSAAIATALAFGLGGRDAAARALERYVDDHGAPPAAPAPPAQRAAAGRGRRPAAAGVMTWEEALAFALTLPDTEVSTSYGQPAVKVAANGRAFLFPSHEADTSFAVALDLVSIELLRRPSRRAIETAHYEGWTVSRALRCP